MTDSPEFRTVDSSFAALVQKGIEKMADFQKIALDFYAHQTADIFDSWKKFALPGASLPGTYVIDVAGHGLRDFVEMQKNMLDLMVRHSFKGMDVLRPALPSAKADEPNTDSIDVLIRERENDAAIATKVVDRIAELLNRADQ